MLKKIKTIYYIICDFLQKIYCQSSLYNKYIQPIIDFQNDIRELLEINPHIESYHWDVFLICSKKKYNIISDNYKLILFNKVKKRL